MTRIIRKYSNRKMYDTETSKPITLGEIAALITEGDSVQVIDNETGEDLTAITLAQIILEQEKDRSELMSVPILLEELIRKGRSSILEFVERSLLASVETISLTEDRAKEIVRELMKKRKLDRAEGQELLKRLLTKAKESKEALQDQIEAVIQSVIKRMHIPTREEFSELKSNLQQINQKIDTLMKLKSGH